MKTIDSSSNSGTQNYSKFILVLIIILFLGIEDDSINQREQYETFLNQQFRTIPGSLVTQDDGVVNYDHPELAAFQDYIMTVDPATGTVPAYRLEDAVRKSREIQSKSGNSGNFFQWQEAASNAGGRTRTIMFDPNDQTQKKVWAGAVTGGLWYNENVTSGLYQWLPVDDFWESLVISSMVYDPLNPEIFYVGTGEPQTAVTIYRESSGVGIGIWRSADGGDTWELLPSTSGFAYVTDMVMRVENGSSVLYAAVVSGIYKGEEHLSDPTDGLYRSTDEGVSWEQVAPNIQSTNTPYALSDLAIGTDNRLYAGTMRNMQGLGAAAILYSDNGTDWVIMDHYHSEITNTSIPKSNVPGRVMLTTSPSDSNIVFAAIGSGAFDDAGFLRTKAYAIIRSENRGETWNKINMPYVENRNWAYLAWHALVVEVDPNDPDVIYAGGLDLHKSMDGGETWYAISEWLSLYGEPTNLTYIHPDLHRIIFQPGSSDIFLVGTDGGVFLTISGSDSIPVFYEKNKNYNTIQYYTCAIHPEAGNNYFLAGTQDNGTFRYLGYPISKDDMISGGDGAYCFVDVDQPEINITSVYYNQYYVFRNQIGNTLNSPNSIREFSSGIFINPADYDYINNTIYANATTFAGDLKDYILRISNIPDEFPTGEFLDLNTGSKVPFSNVKVSPYSIQNSTTLFIGTESGRLFKVQNAESTPNVTEIGGPAFPMGNISSIDVGPNENHLIITFSNYGVPSVWRTTNGGTTWVDVEGDLPDMPVRWVLFHPLDASKAIVATELGIWSTVDLNDNPVDWKPDNSGMANVRTDMLRVRESDLTVIAATHGRGLFVHDNLTLGREKITLTDYSDQVTVYPNPTDGIFWIKTNIEGEIVLEVFDLSGRMILTNEIVTLENRNTWQMDLSEFPQGSYILIGRSSIGKFRKIIVLQ